MSNAAKQEIFMTELTRFQRRLIRFQSPAFNFERASVALLSSLKQHRCLVTKACRLRGQSALYMRNRRVPGHIRLCCDCSKTLVSIETNADIVNVSCVIETNAMEDKRT